MHNKHALRISFFFPYADSFDYHAGYTATKIFSSQQLIPHPAALAKASSLY